MKRNEWFIGFLHSTPFTFRPQWLRACHWIVYARIRYRIFFYPVWYCSHRNQMNDALRRKHKLQRKNKLNKFSVQKSMRRCTRADVFDFHFMSSIKALRSLCARFQFSALAQHFSCVPIGVRINSAFIHRKKREIATTTSDDIFHSLSEIIFFSPGSICRSGE